MIIRSPFIMALCVMFFAVSVNQRTVSATGMETTPSASYNLSMSNQSDFEVGSEMNRHDYLGYDKVKGSTYESLETNVNDDGSSGELPVSNYYGGKPPSNGATNGGTNVHTQSEVFSADSQTVPQKFYIYFNGAFLMMEFFFRRGDKRSLELVEGAEETQPDSKSREYDLTDMNAPGGSIYESIRRWFSDHINIDSIIEGIEYKLRQSIIEIVLPKLEGMKNNLKKQLDKQNGSMTDLVAPSTLVPFLEKSIGFVDKIGYTINKTALY